MITLLLVMCFGDKCLSVSDVVLFSYCHGWWQKLFYQSLFAEILLRMYVYMILCCLFQY